MSKRSFEENNENSKNKKMRYGNISKFTSSDFILNKIHDGDRHVSIMGYVDQFTEIETYMNHESKREFTVFRFILNNDDGCKISFVSYNDNAKNFREKIELHKIILIRNCKKMMNTKYNRGNVPFELQLQKTTNIKEIGSYDFSKKAESAKDFKKFENIKGEKGFIKINGFVFDEFIHSENEKIYTGTITDGRYKIEVKLKNFEKNVDLEIGQKIKLTGEISYNDSMICIIIHEAKFLKVLDEFMKIEDVIEGGEILRIDV